MLFMEWYTIQIPNLPKAPSDKILKFFSDIKKNFIKK